MALLSGSVGGGLASNAYASALPHRRFRNSHARFPPNIPSAARPLNAVPHARNNAPQVASRAAAAAGFFAGGWAGSWAATATATAAVTAAAAATADATAATSTAAAAAAATAGGCDVDSRVSRVLVAGLLGTAANKSEDVQFAGARGHEVSEGGGGAWGGGMSLGVGGGAMRRW